MKIKLFKLVEVRDSLRNFLNSGDMPFNISYRLSDVVPAIDEELKKIEKMNNELVKKYGSVDEKTNAIIVDRNSEKFSEFATEREAFLNEEFKLEIQPISANSLNGSQLKISAVDVSNLKTVGLLVD